MASLRERNRRNAMKLTQRTALAMFIEHGFDTVTVGQIAAEVEMAASTLYRHFDTKEAIVLWDEHEATLDKALERELRRQLPFAALQKVFSDEVGRRYDADLDFQLSRVKYIYATEAIHAAAVEADYRDRAELTAALEHFLSAEHRVAAPLMAGAALLALDAALDRWQQLDAREPLGDLIDQSFRQLAHLEALK